VVETPLLPLPAHPIPSRAEALQALQLGRLAACILGLESGLPAAFADELSRVGMARISRMDEEELGHSLGIEGPSARRLCAAFELGRQVELARSRPGELIRSPGGVQALLAPRVRGLDRETFHVLLLDGRHRLLEVRQVSEGTLTTSLVHPREVYLPALRRPAAAIVVAHNHPSGDPEPSAHDWAVTDRLVRAGRVLGVPVTDHLVIAGPRWVSMRGRARWPTAGEERTRAGRWPRRSTDLGPRRA